MSTLGQLCFKFLTGLVAHTGSFASIGWNAHHYPRSQGSVSSHNICQELICGDGYIGFASQQGGSIDPNQVRILNL